MKVSRTVNIIVGLLWVVVGIVDHAAAQEKVRLSHSALETSNAVWFIAQELGFYKKYGVDSELLYIPSTTTSLTSLLAGDVHVANVSGGAVASAVLAGAQIALVSCYLEFAALRIGCQRIDQNRRKNSKARASASAVSAALPMWRRGRFCAV